MSTPKVPRKTPDQIADEIAGTVRSVFDTHGIHMAMDQLRRSVSKLVRSYESQNVYAGLRVCPQCGGSGFEEIPQASIPPIQPLQSDRTRERIASATGRSFKTCSACGGFGREVFDESSKGD